MRRRPGVTLAELIISMSILFVVVATGVLTSQRARSNTGSRGLAEVLAAELRSARLQALSRRVPVALAFPSANGTQPCCRGYSWLEGRARGEVTRVRSLGTEYLNAALFIGQWPAPGSFAAEDAPAGTSADPAVLPLTNWLPPGQASDPALIFLPSGRVRSLNFPVLNGDYYIVAGQGFLTSGNTLTGVDAPYTIHVSRLGAVVVEKGVSASSVNLETRSAPVPVLAPLLPLPRAPANPPVIREVAALPLANESIHPANQHSVSDSIVDLYPEPADDGRRRFATLSLRAYATDPDGEPLTYSWAVTAAGPGAREGRFSAQQGTMEWTTGDPLNPADDCWMASTDWIPDDEAVPDQSWTFRCTITDSRGHSVTSGGSSATAVGCRVRYPGRIAFDRFRFDFGTGSGQDAIYVMNLDGTAVTPITNVGHLNENSPDWSPSGDWLAFHSTDVNDPNFASDIVMCTGDGKVRVNLTRTRGRDDMYPKWSPRGGIICYYTDGDGDGEYGISTATAKFPPITRNLVEHDANWWPVFPPSFSPDGRYIAFLYTDPATGYNWLKIRDYKGAEPGRLRWQGADRDVLYAKWSPRGDRILMVTWDEALALVTIDPSDPMDTSIPANVAPRVVLMPQADGVVDADWDPTGRKIAVSARRGGSAPDLFVITLNDDNTIQSLVPYTQGQDTAVPVFSADGRFIIVQNYQPTRNASGTVAYDAYQLYRVPAEPPANPYTTMPLLTEESADVTSHSVSR